jgi:dsDNA-specific endonuclease/ATPase MutS2
VGWILALGALLAVLLYFARALARRDPVVGPEGDDESGPDPDYEREIGDELDLHGLPTEEAEEIVVAFLEEAQERGRPRVKIVHGKGTGRLRARVHRILERHPGVVRFEDGLAGGSGWGATIVHLAPPSEVAPQPHAD